ncbi:ABC transporter permease subunit [Desulfococcaceae bacterium HSG9]|nr:ABC transporter permease subunit [Desulfococcaceae bacterium HSG9]
MIGKLKKYLPEGRTLVIAIPLVWMLLFFLIPFAIVLKISFSEMMTAIPPFSTLWKYADEMLNVKLNMGNYLFLLTDDLYISAYINSVKMATLSTVFCLLIGYPMAYSIANASPTVRNILLLGIVLPSWTSFLIRIYAWIGILKNNGLFNNFLMGLGVIDQPLIILNTNIAVYIGIVYAYLPFMILPLYTNLVKHDHTLLEAAYDLGARPWKSFLAITIPLSFPGIVAGSMLIFIPVVGEFVIPELLGGSETLMIGRVLWQEFFNNRDWPVASAVAIIMLLLLAIPVAVFHHYQSKEAL